MAKDNVDRQKLLSHLKGAGYRKCSLHIWMPNQLTQKNSEEMQRSLAILKGEWELRDSRITCTNFSFGNFKYFKLTMLAEKWQKVIGQNAAYLV